MMRMKSTIIKTILYLKGPIYGFQIEMLKSWEGDMKKLGNAERFLLQLIDVKK